MGSKTADLAGTPPPEAPWGKEEVLCSPDLARRLEVLSPLRPELCVVFGASGSEAQRLKRPMVQAHKGSYVFQ